MIRRAIDEFCNPVTRANEVRITESKSWAHHVVRWELLGGVLLATCLRRIERES